MKHARPHSNPFVRPLTGALLVAITTLSFAAAPLNGTGASAQDEKKSTVDPQWLDRLDAVDRGLADENIGYAPPKFTSDLKWHKTDALTWEGLRGKVVVLQSWSSKQSLLRGIPARTMRSLEAFGAEVTTIFVHTPDGADNAENYIERIKVDAPMVVDPTGAFLDELGIYRDPVNVVIDRQGAVRYAGLNARGLTQAVEKLVAEKFDESKKPEARPAEVKASAADEAKFPTFTNDPQSRVDVRGQRAPEFHIQEWISQPADPRGKVLIVEFSATWCGPCVAMLPHMNELASQFRGDVEVMWITNETPQKFFDGMKGKNLTPQSFAFPVASDPETRMMKAVGASGWPTALVISSDWIVRWQGHPQYLKAADLKKIVDANKAIAGASSKRYRWTGNAG